jgi:hypothetical protein
VELWLAVVSTLAGGVSGTNGVYSDTFGTNAGFSYPLGIAVDVSGIVYVADSSNQRIRKVTAGGGTQRRTRELLAYLSFVHHVALSRAGFLRLRLRTMCESTPVNC